LGARKGIHPIKTYSVNPLRFPDGTGRPRELADPVRMKKMPLT